MASLTLGGEMSFSQAVPSDPLLPTCQEQCRLQCCPTEGNSLLHNAFQPEHRFANGRVLNTAIFIFRFRMFNFAPALTSVDCELVLRRWQKVEQLLTIWPWITFNAAHSINFLMLLTLWHNQRQLCEPHAVATCCSDIRCHSSLPWWSRSKWLVNVSYCKIAGQDHFWYLQLVKAINVNIIFYNSDHEVAWDKQKWHCHDVQGCYSNFAAHLEEGFPFANESDIWEIQKSRSTFKRVSQHTFA